MSPSGPPPLPALLRKAPVPFRIIQAAPGSYVPVLLPAGQQPGRLAGMNAGNSPGLWVGGGGINAAFANAIGPASQQFGALHSTLLASLPAQPPRIASTVYPAGGVLSFAMVRAPDPGCTFNGNDGMVFIDVFASGACPAGNSDNYAMVYVCPPNGSGYATEPAFLAAVQATAANVIEALRYFNQTLVPATPGLQTIAILRACLFSSGIYRPPSTPVSKVAQAVCAGLLGALAGPPTGLTLIQLPGGVSAFGALA